MINDSYRIGVNIFHRGQWSSLSLADQSGGDEYATTICQTHNGNIWIGGLGKLYSYDGKTWRLYQSPEYNVPGNKLLLSPALDGSLWVLGFKSRVIYVDHSEERWKAFPGLNYQDESEAGIWFLDRNDKIVLQKDDQWLAYGQRDGLMDAPVRLITTSRGQVWAAGSHQGQAATAYLDGQTWVMQTHPNLSWGIDYRAVFEDREGNLWFGGSVDIEKEKGQQYCILIKNQKLGRLNHTLRNANQDLQEQGEKILAQNQHILPQQREIIEQKDRLEAAHQYLAVSHDRIEQQRDTLKEMVSQVERLSKAKLNFFTNISHELRTPLTLLMGPVEQLLHQGQSMPARQRQELLQLVKRNANRLLILINQLLEIPKIESSSMQCNEKPGNLRYTIDNTLELFQNLAQMRQLQLTIEDRLPQPWLYFDHDKTEKILANLLSNAVKHTPDHGHIHLTLSMTPTAIVQEQEHLGPWLCLQVEDDGEGIPTKDLAHIFNRYYSAQPEGHLSTGIGLSYIHDLVEVQQGHVNLDSEEGAGTVVTAYLPYKPTEAPIGIPDTTIPMPSNEASLHVASLTTQWTNDEAPGKAERDQQLLIVEDNADMRQFLIGLFTPRYQVLEACDGKEGLQKAREHGPDLIISDIMMPGMDGLDFCRHLKSDLPISHFTVILLNAKGSAPNKVEGYHLGADDYITKPFQPDVLEARVENLLTQRDKLRRLYQQQFMMKPQEVRLESPDERMLAKLSQLMEEHVDDPEFNVNKMCEAVDMSHMQFIRKIKQLTGKKPVELLKSFRLTRAKDLLRQNKLTISEVAYLVGYDLPNSFSRAFKKEFGISPTEFLEREVAREAVQG